MGPVDPPVPAPDLVLVNHSGQPLRLRTWLQGRVTLVQTIFTGCTSVCPIQGALFAEVQRHVAAQPRLHAVQLLSISIDALGDTPASLARWLEKMGARQPGWVAALPRPADVEPLQSRLRGGVAIDKGLDSHSESVYVFDEKALLRWRTFSLPTANEVMRVVAHFAA
ncbi:MAG TPA: SCO family protein [Burkholderiaceae bacterium]|nr:SCO family protein [Burkholderiaceae bacterium]